MEKKFLNGVCKNRFYNLFFVKTGWLFLESTVWLELCYGKVERGILRYVTRKRAGLSLSMIGVLKTSRHLFLSAPVFAYRWGATATEPFFDDLIWNCAAEASVPVLRS